MARKSATKTAARERARAAMAERVKRENRIEEQVQVFFMAAWEKDQRREKIRAKIAQLEEELRELDTPSEEAAVHVRALKTENLKNGEMADLLGMIPGDVTKCLKNFDDSRSDAGAAGVADRSPVDDVSEGTDL